MSCAWGDGSKSRREMGVMERKEWGDTDEAGPATMTSRRWDGSDLGTLVARRDLPQ